MAECKYQKTTLPTVARKKNTSRNIYVSAQCVVFNGGRYKPRNLSQSSWVIIPIVRTPDNPTTNAFRRRKRLTQDSPARTCARSTRLAAPCRLLYRINFHIDRPLVRYHPAFQSFGRNRRFYCGNNRHRHHCRANGRRLHCHSSSDIAP